MPFPTPTAAKQSISFQRRLDDKVGATIPEFACNGKEAVTVAHLLTHRGGFPDSDPAVRRKLFPIMRDWDAALNFVCDMELAWEPGTARGYHPFTGWLIVGELVQRLDARPLAESVWARVLEPAGVARASWSLGEPDQLETPPLRVETNGDLVRRSESGQFSKSVRLQKAKLDP